MAIWPTGRDIYHQSYIDRVVPSLSRWLPTAGSGICGGQSGNGVGFLRVLRFLVPVILPTVPHSSSIIQDRHSKPNSGRHTKWTQSHPIRRNLKKKQITLTPEIMTSLLPHG
jgi:hypothetical protein